MRPPSPQTRCRPPTPWLTLGSSPLAFVDGSFIFLGAVLAFLGGAVFAVFTITGSGIRKHPSDGLDGAPGSAGPSEASGRGRSPDAPHEGGPSGEFDVHGTQ